MEEENIYQGERITKQVTKGWNREAVNYRVTPTNTHKIYVHTSHIANDVVMYTQEFTVQYLDPVNILLSVETW